jgi:IPT/TIG domain-containing protein
MRLLSRSKYLLLLSLFLFSSCEEELESEALVFAEDVIFVSGEILRITGRVVSSGSVTITDHGFQIAENPEFTSPIIVSLGERSIPGRFIGTYEHLSPGTDFYVRAFLVSKGETQFSESLEFSSLESELIDFSPIFDIAGKPVTINGKNLTRSSEVFFGTKKATILEFNNEAEIIVRVPDPVIGDFSVPLRIVTDGDEQVFEKNFEYIIGKWGTESIYPGDAEFTRNAYFQHEGKLFTGMEKKGSDTQLFWTYDPLTGAWEEKDFGGTFVKIPGVFDGGFFGGKLDQIGTTALTNEFWTLDQSGNFSSQGVVPFKLWLHVSFRVGDDLFVFGGQNEFDAYNNRIKKYNFISKEWVDLGIVPIITSSRYPTFNNGNQMFFVTASNELWKYDASTSQWEQMASYPGEEADLAIGGTIGDYAYVGIGHRTREMYEYEFALDSWKEKTIIPGFTNDITLGWYTVGEEIYVLRKLAVGGGAPKMYKFEPFNF